MSDNAILGVVVAAVVLTALAAWFLGTIPGRIAARRGHPSATAIRICGLFGILFWPCWFVALIWAYTGGLNPEEPDYHYGTPPRRTGETMPGVSRRRPPA